MADDAKTDDAQKGGTDDASADKGDKGGDKTFTQAELDAKVDERLKRERIKANEKYGDYDEVKKKAAEFDKLSDAQKSDLEKLTGKVDGLSSENATLKADKLRLEVAIEKGLTGDKAGLANRLSGNTKDELLADADELLKLVGPGKTDDGDADADKNGGQDKNGQDDKSNGPGMDGGQRGAATGDDQNDAALDAFWNERAGIYQPAGDATTTK